MRTRAFAALLDRAVLVAVLVADAVGVLAASLLAVRQGRPALLDRLSATAVAVLARWQASVCLILMLLLPFAKATMMLVAVLLAEAL